MAIDPPWRLDPWQNIKGVGWGGGGKIAVLELQYDTTGSPPVMELYDLPYDVFGSSVFNPLSTLKVMGDTLPNPPDVEQTITPAMRRLLLWSYPFWASSTTSSHTGIVTIIDWGRWNISNRWWADAANADDAIAIILPTFIELYGREPDPGELWAELDLRYPYTSHEEEVTTITNTQKGSALIFFPIGKISALIEAAKPPPPVGSPPVLPSPFEFKVKVTFDFRCSWLARLSTYKDKNDFPATEKNEAQWDRSTTLDEVETSRAEENGTNTLEYSIDMGTEYITATYS